MKWVEKWKVPSASSDRIYTVSLADDGTTWGCSCPRWKFHREQCHHIQEVQANPKAYVDGSPKILPEILPGHVEAVEIIDGRCLHPLIPISGPGSEVLATVCYDLLGLGYSWGAIRSRFRMIPKQWTMRAVLAHVRRDGRTLCKTYGPDEISPTIDRGYYETVPVEAKAKPTD